MTVLCVLVTLATSGGAALALVGACRALRLLEERLGASPGPASAEQHEPGTG